MTREQFFNYCRDHLSTSPDYPFDDANQTAVLRHESNRKWFGIVMYISKSKLGIHDSAYADVLNVKLPLEMFGYFTEKDGVFPAYHMSKKHWVSILLEKADDDTVKILTNASYDVTRSKVKKAKEKM
ncbi:MAG: MmcQ/YjbR family DNA-binding protein [Clostridia bacterium]|nr:MmcQ/YjbR family DNA-binding protein [Clostridia bacterium]